MTEVTKEFIQKNEDEKIIEIEIERLGLVKQGKRVLLIDADPQGSLTASLLW